MSYQDSSDATVTRILDQLDRIEANQLKLSQHLGISLQNAPGSIAEPSPHQPPSGGKKLNPAAHHARLEGLFDYLLTTELIGKFLPISGESKLRIYFIGDESFLWYDESGRLWAGQKGTTKDQRKNCEAQIAIETYSLDKQIFKPTFKPEEPA
jgi:hypothetical protein